MSTEQPPMSEEAPVLATLSGEGGSACGFRARRALGAAAAVGFLALLGCAEFYRRNGMAEGRPTCEEGEDPLLRDCLPAAPHVDWKDPSSALVKPNETLVQIRWFKGKLFHPLGRFFGGHHSMLVGTFSSGQQVRIEKFGTGKVQYCPIKGKTSCNLSPGELYKSAGGKFVSNITWAQLHGLMIHDLEHYDVVDANCHHVVQDAWNAAVAPSAQDRSPAPDHGLVRNWEGFLRRWAQPEADPTSQERTEEAEARLLADDVDNFTGLPQFDAEKGPGAFFTAHGIAIASFDQHSVRRRRRRQAVAERCRGSSLDHEDNCPNRESCFMDGSSGDQPSSKKQCEMCSKWRSQMSSFLTLWKDKDYTGSKSRGQSDCSFQRKLSCGGEQDISGSMHWRNQCSRPSSQSEVSEESSGEALPMDANHIEGNSKNNEDNSACASESSHSQHGRSKGDEAEVCNYDLTGVQGPNQGDFMCEWTCVSGDVVFLTDSTSSFVCQGEDSEPTEIALTRGQSEAQCMQTCVASGCTDDCTKTCRYIASAAMNAGQAACMTSTLEVTSTGYSYTPLENRGLSPGVIVGIICYFCCQCCCGVIPQVAKKMKSDGVRQIELS